MFEYRNSSKTSGNTAAALAVAGVREHALYCLGNMFIYLLFYPLPRQIASPQSSLHKSMYNANTLHMTRLHLKQYPTPDVIHLASLCSTSERVHVCVCVCVCVISCTVSDTVCDSVSCPETGGITANCVHCLVWNNCCEMTPLSSCLSCTQT